MSLLSFAAGLKNAGVLGGTFVRRDSLGTRRAVLPSHVGMNSSVSCLSISLLGLSLSSMIRPNSPYDNTLQIPYPLILQSSSTNGILHVSKSWRCQTNE